METIAYSWGPRDGVFYECDTVYESLDDINQFVAKFHEVTNFQKGVGICVIREERIYRIYVISELPLSGSFFMSIGIFYRKMVLEPRVHSIFINKVDNIFF